MKNDITDQHITKSQLETALKLTGTLVLDVLVLDPDFYRFTIFISQCIK
jgi:hypothetical protein